MYLLVGLVIGVAGAMLFGGMGDDQAKLEAANKAVVVAYERAAFEEKNIEKAAALVADNLIQHNPTVPNGKEGVINGIGGYLLKQFPNLKITEKRVLTNGDYVIVHKYGQFDSTNAADPGVAIIDIFRLEDGKIAEHWDVIQPIPAQAANENTMF